MIKKIIKFIKKNSFLNFLDIKLLRRWYYCKENSCFLELKRISKLQDIEKSGLQNKKLIELLMYAYKYSPYYQQLFKQNNIDYKSIVDFQNIPFLTKQIIRKNCKNILSKKIFLMKRNTGGSTGEPIDFFSDLEAGAIDWAHHRYLFDLMGYEAGDIIADAGGIFISKAQRKKEIYWIKYVKNDLRPCIEYSALYLNDYTIGFYVKNILLMKPSILRGYPSFWSRISEYILLNNIRIDFHVKGVNLTAELCSFQQRVNIEKAFFTNVYFEYGQSEMVAFCYTRDNTYAYITSPIYGYIEVIKSNGEYAQQGEKGEIVATSLCNKGMPFIRYKTGDVGVVAKKTGGMVYFKEIIGRTQDYIFSNNKQKIPLTALIFGQHFSAFNKISNWQLEQRELGEIYIRIVKLPGYSQKDEDEIKEKICNVAKIDLQFNYVNEIPLTPSGKHLFLIQKLEGI